MMNTPLAQVDAHGFSCPVCGSWACCGGFEIIC
nr:MAG TPA: Rad50 zinc hook motif [Caudoviricetes sp.]